MKLGKSVLLELIAIVQTGLVEGRDISEMLRELDVVVSYDGNVFPEDDTLELSAGYIAKYPRATDWKETE